MKANLKIFVIFNNSRHSKIKLLINKYFYLNKYKWRIVFTINFNRVMFIMLLWTMCSSKSRKCFNWNISRITCDPEISMQPLCYNCRASLNNRVKQCTSEIYRLWTFLIIYSNIWRSFFVPKWKLTVIEDLAFSFSRNVY